jgi:hypothetical protein
MVDDFFGSYSGGSDVFTDPASFDLGGIDNSTGITTDPIYYENSGVGTTASGEFIDPNAVLNDVAYQGVTGNPNVSPADVTRMINADSTGLLKKLFVDDKGNLNLKTLAGIGGGILGALGANTPNIKKVGYQGGIPKYDAVRNMVNAPPTRAQGYRPGQGGINYGGDVSFVPRGTGASMAAAQPSQTINQAPAGAAGIMAGLAGMGGSADYIDRKNLLPPPPMSLADERRIQDMRSKNLSIDSFLNPQRPATAQPISRDDPFYQSAEYKAFQNDPSNMTGTMDMYDSPYFGRMSSGSVGSAMDAAYEKYKNIAPRQNQQIPAMFNQFNSLPIENRFAQGGLMGLASGRYLQGETDGMADKIPAKIGQDQPAALSHGEFVIPADVVSHLGNGNSDAGAKKLYSMMDKIRTARTGTKKQGKEINPDKFMPGGLAQAYANGGAVKGFSGTTGSAVTGLGSAAAAGVTGSETTPNTFAGEYIGDMLGKGQALANAPYQQYMGPLTAGESGLQSKVFGGLQNTNFPSNFGQSFSSTGAYAPPQMNMDAYKTQPIGTGPMPGMTPPGGQPNAGIAGLPQQPQQPQGIASQYMNPYLQSVLDPQMAELRRQNDITNMMSNAKATGMGAFGGGRQAIMNAENNRNLMQEMNKTVGQGYASAYDKAQNQFNIEQGQGMGLARLMADQGAQQRGIEAEGIAADKAAFEAARENPYKMLQFQQSMLQGMPISATNIETTTPSKLQEVLSGIGGGIKMLGNKPEDISLKSVTDLLGNLGLGKAP